MVFLYRNMALVDIYSDDDGNDGGEGDDKYAAGDDENDVDGDSGYAMERGDKYIYICI